MKTNDLTFYSKEEILRVLKSFDRDTLIFLHVFPFFNNDIYTFYTYLCEVRSANALISMLHSETRYTFKLNNYEKDSTISFRPLEGY